MKLWVAAVITLCALQLSPPQAAASAREPAPAGDKREIDLRAEQLSRLREAKLDSLTARRQSLLERGLIFVENEKLIDKLRYGYYGFFLKFGGLSTKAALAMGVRYLHGGLSKNSSLDWSASFSMNKYQRYDAGVNLRRIGGLPLGFDLRGIYRNYPEEEHFGLGPSSSRERRSAYRVEDFRGSLNLSVRPLGGFSVGGGAGYIRSRTGSGTSDDAPSVGEVLESGDIAGFSEVTEHWLSSLSAELDYRDSPGNPRSGFSLNADHTIYADQGGDEYDFRISTAELQGYIPFLHKHRVIALRGHVSSAAGRGAGVVPFQFLPYAGGSETIRGFREFRFRDSKLLVVNLEYRFEAFIGLDMAVFGDLGQVASEWDRFRTSDFRSSYGAGLRFNTAQSVFLRFDVGHGEEGTRAYLKFSNVF